MKKCKNFVKNILKKFYFIIFSKLSKFKRLQLDLFTHINAAPSTTDFCYLWNFGCQIVYLALELLPPLVGGQLREILLHRQPIRILNIGFIIRLLNNTRELGLSHAQKKVVGRQ